MSNNPEPRLLEHHPWLMVRLSSSTVAAGIFLSLCLWALYDMRFVQRRKTIFLNNGDFLVLFTVFAIISMLEIVEFFLIYDFIFFKSALDWSDERQTNRLAWLIEYGRVLQFSVLLASGVHQILSLLSCCKFGTTGGFLLAFNFLGMSLVLPTLALFATIHFYGTKHQTLHDVLHPTLVPFSAGLITSGFLFFISRKQLLKLNYIDVLLTKLMILWQLLIVFQALLSTTIDHLVPLLDSRPWFPMLNTTEDIIRPCYPIGAVSIPS